MTNPKTDHAILTALLAQMRLQIVICDVAGVIQGMSQSASQFLKTHQLPELKVGDSFVPLFAPNEIDALYKTIETHRLAQQNTSFEFICLLQSVWTRFSVFTIHDAERISHLIFRIDGVLFDQQPRLKIVEQSWIEQMRAGISSIRAAIEMIHNYPTMDEAVAQQFRQIILDQTIQLTQYLADSENDTESTNALTTFSYISQANWQALLAQKLKPYLKKDTSVSLSENTSHWLFMDVLLFHEALVFLLNKLKTMKHFQFITWEIIEQPQHCLLKLQLDGAPLKEDRLEKWMEMVLTSEEVQATLKLEHIFKQHSISYKIDVTIHQICFALPIIYITEK